MDEKRTVPKRADILIIAAGAVLILSALLLFLFNRLEDVHAGQQARDLMANIEAVIANISDENASNGYGGTALFTSTSFNQSCPQDPSLPYDRSCEHDREMPTVTLNGYEYVGYLRIPALALELPVMSEWDYDRLKIAPCRQFGSSCTDDLVIAAHNYQSHFGHLKELTAGDTVIFTEMDGQSSTYSVQDIRILQPTEIGSVQDSDFDLVLYTCTYGGKSRVTVFCRRVGNPA